MIDMTTLLFKQISLFLLFTFSIQSLKAATINAISGGNWEDVSNWDCNCVPGPSDDVIIDGYSIEIKTSTGNVSVHSITLTNTGTSQSVLEIKDNVILTIAADLTMTSINNNKAISFQAKETSTTNIGSNVNMERTADNNVSAKLQFFMNSSSVVNVTGNFTFNYQNSGNSEGSNELDLNGTCTLNVGQNMTLTHAGGNNFHCNLDNSAQIIIGGTFDFTQTGGDNAKVSLGTNCKLQSTGDMTFTKSGGSLDLDIDSNGNSYIISGGDFTLNSTIAGNTIDLDCAGNINVTDHFELDSQAAGDIDLNLTNDGLISLGGNFIRTSGFGVLSMGNSSKIIYNGTSAQQIAANAGAGGDSFEFTNIEINNNSGSRLALQGELLLTKHLTLTNGVLETTATNILIIEGGSCDAGNEDSFIDGPMKKTKGGAFTFPLGDGSVYAPLTISNPGGQGDYIVQYFNNSYSNTSSMTGDLHMVSNIEYWNVTKNGGNDVEITLNWSDADQSGINDLASLRVARYNGSNWLSEGSNNLTGSTGAGVSGSITSNSLNEYGPFTFGSTTGTNNFLPVELEYFRGQYDESSDQVNFEWRTASEFNNDYFEIEKSSNGLNFEPIGQISGYGFSEIPMLYDFEEKNPGLGNFYYRLKQVDFDGNYDYSSIINLKIGNQLLGTVQLYPNPSTDYIFLEIPKIEKENALDLMIVNQAGQTVFQQSLPYFSDVEQIDISQLPTGFYFLKMQMGKEKSVLKFLKE